MIPIARSILKTSIKNVPTKVSSVLYIKQNIIRKSSTIITEFSIIVKKRILRLQLSELQARSQVTAVAVNYIVSEKITPITNGRPKSVDIKNDFKSEFKELKAEFKETRDDIQIMKELFLTIALKASSIQ
ncbi:21840_t:CDS:2 [Rhizophagus irregularis]|nr:21840_t:CDS:2 [Rhizophagus irregularis]